jgi:hypothetical protein
MKQAAVVLATMVYNAATTDARLPRKPLPVEPNADEKVQNKAQADKRQRLKDRKALGELSDVKR